MVGKSRLLITAAFLFLLHAGAFNQIRQIWALGDGGKVFCNEDNHADKHGNLIWDGPVDHN